MCAETAKFLVACLVGACGCAAEPATPEAKLIAAGRISEHRRIRMADGVQIDTWICLAAGAERVTRGTVLFLPGMMDAKCHHLWLARRVQRMGYDAVLLDLRGRGQTGGHATFGAKGKYDVKAVVDALLTDATTAEPIFVFGISMGASTGILYAAIDPRCRGVVAVAPFRDYESIVAPLIPAIGESSRRGVLRGLARLAGFDPREASTVEAAKQLTVPLIVIHGADDRLIPVQHARDVFQAAAGPRRLHVIPGAGHVNILTDREDWLAQQVAELSTMGPDDR